MVKKTAPAFSPLRMELRRSERKRQQKHRLSFAGEAELAEYLADYDG